MYCTYLIITLLLIYFVTLENGNKKPDEKKNKMNKMEKKEQKQAFRMTFQKIVALRNHSKI